MCSKDSDRMGNSGDPDQTDPSGGRLIIFSLLESWYVASKPVCGLTSYKLRSSVLTSSLKLSVLCERLGIRIVISGLLIVNHGFRFR